MEEIIDVSRSCLLCVKNEGVCGGLQLENLSVSDKKNVLSSLAKLEAVMNRNIDTHYCNYICQNCKQELDQAYQFRVKVEISLEYWKTHFDLKKENKEELLIIDYENVDLHEEYEIKKDMETDDSEVVENDDSEVVEHAYLDVTEHDDSEGVDNDNMVKSETSNEKQPFKPLSTYNCYRCKVVFPTISKLLHHKCCPTKTNDKAKSTKPKAKTEVDVAFPKHITSIKYVCLVCNESFKQSHELAEHSRKHTGERKFSCKFCDKTFPSLPTLNTHVKSHYILPEAKKNPVLCIECEKLKIPGCRKCKLQNNSSELMIAEPPNSPKKTVMECYRCKLAFQTAFQLLNHKCNPNQEKTLKIIKSSEAPKPEVYVCSVCNETFKHMKALLDHSAKHAANKIKLQEGLDKTGPIECYRCKVLFECATDLLHHKCIPVKIELLKQPKPKVQPQIKVVNPIQQTKHECNICKKIFVRRNVLLEHMTIHTGTKNFCCSLCGKTFARLSSVSKHTKSHYALPGHKAKKTPFLCMECGKRFPYSNSFQRHMRVHRGIRPHQCQVCEKRFAQRHHLNTHMRKHTGEAPFVCEHCGLAFKSNQAAINHRKRHFKEERQIKKEEDSDNNDYLDLNHIIPS